jgi:hypothetical protein
MKLNDCIIQWPLGDRPLPKLAAKSFDGLGIFYDAARPGVNRDV